MDKLDTLILKTKKIKNKINNTENINKKIDKEELFEMLKDFVDKKKYNDLKNEIEKIENNTINIDTIFDMVWGEKDE